jgi:COP9 signalosome complex subunit 5
MSCYHKLNEIYVENDPNVVQVNFDGCKNGGFLDRGGFYEIPQINEKLAKSKPWKRNPQYFTKAYISALTLMKMTLHAKSGGSIEVMGMLTGKIVDNGIVVMDAYQLPVEGTETRVNAQAEGYEYMVQFLESNKANGKPEHIVGWYHSHPGYGCWLSGIDVGTQALNQNFQDPYLALVVDPLKTSQQNKVEIGAFRTFPEAEGGIQQERKLGMFRKGNTTSNSKTKLESKSLPASKRQDFGVHAERYYSLDIEIFSNEIDSKILDMVLSNDNRIYELLDQDNEKSVKNDDDFITDESLNMIFQIFSKLKSYNFNHLKINDLYNNKFESVFEAIATKKSFNSPTSYKSVPLSEGFRLGGVDDSSDDEMVESDVDLKRNCKLDNSDVDDAISVESSTRQDDDDELEERKDMLSSRVSEKRRIQPSRISWNLLGGYNEVMQKMKLAKNLKSLSSEIEDTNREIGKQELNELFTIETQARLFM